MARPVVQVMRRAVAVATFRELGMHCSRVRFTVAIAALGHGLVLINVTSHTSHLVMLGLAGSQLSVSRVVTGRTETGTRIGTVLQLERLMCLVTSSTVVLDHGLGVRRVTCNTIGDIPVRVGMAEVTG